MLLLNLYRFYRLFEAIHAVAEIFTVRFFSKKIGKKTELVSVSPLLCCISGNQLVLNHDWTNHRLMAQMCAYSAILVCAVCSVCKGLEKVVQFNQSYQVIKFHFQMKLLDSILSQAV